MNVNKCECYYDGLCMKNPILDDYGHLLCYAKCNEKSDCYFKLIKKLRQENNELKIRLQNMTEVSATHLSDYFKEHEKIEKIKDIAENGIVDEFNMPLDELSVILKIIKGV